MGKSNAILTKALNEADTIRNSALKNAEDILFQAFSPKFQKMFDSVVEQVGVHDNDPMDGPDNSFNQTDGEAHDNLNPDDSPREDGKGPELLEQEEEEDGEELEEQEDATDTEEDDIEEQTEEDDEDDWEVDEITMTEDDADDDEDMEEQELPGEDDDDVIEIVEQEDDEDDTEEVEEQLKEQDDDEEDAEEVEEVKEQTDVNVSSDPKVVTASNEQLKKENANLKTKVKKLTNENTKLNNGVLALSKKIKQINLFNAKVACANSVLTSKGIDEDIKVEALKNLDKCKNISEIKVAFGSFKSMLAISKKKNSTLRESRNINALKNKNMGYKKAETNPADAKMLRLAGITE